jgi:hypothetical protein
MRTAALVLLAWVVAVPAFAQTATAPGCYPVGVAGVVEVTMVSGNSLRGTLLCIGEAQVVLASHAKVESHPLADIRRIVKPADGIGDGFLKGAAVAALIYGLCGGECRRDAGDFFAAVVVYGAIGAGIDALHGGSLTVYTAGSRQRASPASALALTLRF